MLASGAVVAAPCLSDAGPREQVAGRLSIGKARDAAGRPARPYILTLAAPVCLTSQEPDESVDRTLTVHLFSTDDATRAQIAKFIGKQVIVRGRPMSAHTAHHHAPIVMDIVEIKPR